ncbi:MAG: murein biosynthesis integral membrane protein MurJ [Planctomycetota bacterium]
MADLERNTRTVAGVTLISRVFGLARDLVLVRIFGDTPTGSAFNAAFALPNLFRRLFGEGALSAAFLPRYTTLTETDPELSRKYASLVIALLLGVTAALTILGEAALLIWLTSSGQDDTDRALSIRLMMLMLPLMPLVCIVAILGGMLQVGARFAMPAAAPIVLNLCMIGAAIGAIASDASPERAATAIALATLAAGFVQLAWALIALRPLVRFTTAFTDARHEASRTLRRFLPVLVGMGTLQLNTLADTLLAMWPVWIGPTLLGNPVPMDDASNAIVGFTQRLYQFPLGVFGIAVATAAFPQLARDAGNPAAFGSTLARGLRLSVFIGLPASIGLLLVREDLVAVMFSGGFSDDQSGFSDDGLTRAATVLAGYALAVWAFSLNHLLTRAFYARSDTTTPMRVSLAMVAVNLALNLTLIWRFREAGLAIATAVTSTLQMALLALLLSRRLEQGIPRSPMLRGIARTAAASIAMGVAVWLVLTLLPDATIWHAHATRLGAAVATGLASYLSLSWRSDELRQLLSRR